MHSKNSRLIEVRAMRLAVVAVLVSSAWLAGCGHKTPSGPQPVLPAPATPPTASISATPSNIQPGESVVLTWHTSDANDVSIDGLGSVAPNDSATVTPKVSTTYHLVAKGDAGSSDASAIVTVGGNGQGTSNPSSSDLNGGDDALFQQNMQDLFFDYDSYDVRPDAQPVITKDAAFLNSHTGYRIVVGGYCDERGSTEYNIALGQNRANSAKEALVKAGVSAARIRVISYGKEKQFCTDHNEACWQQNRRGAFSVDK